ncbi:MHS family proline/betaine transporter-like MFS transporter [Arthrobacter sp. SLBN-112]|jgi:MFS transporter, MHS family, proline/betaine transporter|uniref:MFS transporter n=1 Tax=Arthrobacter sp. SLBN-112 TaxID=2768452 RepID=UPI001152F396|nr:MFS transporter [Arthrobacter sp. SLBN-112]TQJ38701.1 MHS family proline/betaine transporter-like MFS transporter [Arthrobacter sp. SLBN-112]
MSHEAVRSVGPGPVTPEAPAPAAGAAELKNAKKAVVAAAIGNGLEWFDLIVYGTFAVTISKLFFPTTNETASLLLTFASFGVSFIMRPLGGIIIGRYADRAGRKAGMMVSILVMFIGTLLIVLAPTAVAIGITASILVLVARLLQGFATGGEFGTATAYLIEYAPNRKAFYASWQVATQGTGILLAGIFGFVLNTYLSVQSLESWGWRLPFIFALAIGPVGWYIRSKMKETPEFMATERSEAPLKETLIGNGGRLWAIVGVVSLGSVGVYIALFMPTYAIVNLGMPKTAAFVSTLIFGVVMSIGSPFIGMLADKAGPARVMTWAAVGTILIGIPAFLLLMAAPGLPMMVLVELILSVLATAYFAPLPAIMSSMFPARIRSTGLSLGYNIGVTVFGGFAPFILTWLIDRTGSLLVPGYYLVGVAAIATASLAVSRKVFRQA